MRKARWLPALGAVAAMVGAGVLGSATAISAKTQVTVWVNWSSIDATAFQHELKLYEKVNPGVKVSLLTNVSEQKMNTAISGGNPPDLLIYGTPYVVGSLAADGAIQSLASFQKEDPLNLRNIEPSALSWCRYQGAYYCMPSFNDTFGLLYNKTLFAQAGIKSPPTTWQQLSADAAKLTVKNKNGSYKTVGFVPDFPYSHAELYLMTWGVPLWNAKARKVELDTPAAVAALNWEASFYKNYGVTALDKFEAGFGGYLSPFNAFFQGKVAMEIDGDWMPGFIKTYAPKLDYGVAPIPYPANMPSMKGVNEVAGNAMVIPRGSPNPMAAWRLIKFVETNQGTSPMAEAVGAMPQLKSAIHDPKLSKVGQFSSFVPFFSSPKIRVWPVMPVEEQYLDTLYSEEALIIRGRIGAGAGLAYVQSTIQSALAKAGY